MTTYRLADIRPNPFRNIPRYPIKREKVEKLKESIGRTDFWDNLVARIGADGKPEIGYGHHRMVALRELFDDDHEISLIVRDLDDAAMLHVMADENMQEWGSDSTIDVETVRAVRDYLRVSAARGKRPHGAADGKAENGAAITAFLGWSQHKVDDALAILNAEESDILRPEDTAGLTLKAASALRTTVSAPIYRRQPELKAKTIARVREEVLRPDRERIGYRSIPDVARQVREEAASAPEPKVPAAIAKGIHADIDNFWRVAVGVNGRTFTRPQIIRLIAENRDAAELTVTALGLPWAEQIATALDEMADTAHSLATVLRAGSAVEVAS